jgi:hypothetical protein
MWNGSVAATELATFGFDASVAYVLVIWFSRSVVEKFDLGLPTSKDAVARYVFGSVMVTATTAAMHATAVRRNVKRLRHRTPMI